MTSEIESFLDKLGNMVRVMVNALKAHKMKRKDGCQWLMKENLRMIDNRLESKFNHRASIDDVVN